jgi:Bifunctional DNA primase/polymerase, N-terminal
MDKSRAASTLARAEHYQGHHGWGLLPLRGKEPNFELIRRFRATSSTRSFWKRAADLDEIHGWFELDPQTNIGVCCGEVSGGLTVLDQDSEPPADVRVPMTALVRTGRGYQSYFSSDTTVATRAFKWGELRGEGTYCVVPPSLHPSGARYRWLLDPETTGIAPLESLILPSVEPGVSRGISPTCFSSVLLAADGRPLAQVESDETVATALGGALGITAPLGRSFRCVLHPDRRASATLWRRDEGVPFLYHDWHRGSRWLSLALVRATLAGRPNARGPELATWKLRLLAEAGLVKPVRIGHVSCDGLDETSRLVYERFLFLLGCRWLVMPGEPAPFTWRFGAAWCGLPERRFADGFVQLRRLGLVRPAGVAGRIQLWLPGGDAMV